jgi:hypothetical protein
MRLSLLFGGSVDNEYELKLRKLISAFYNRLERAPFAMPQLLVGLMLYHKQIKQVRSLNWQLNSGCDSRHDVGRSHKSHDSGRA